MVNSVPRGQLSLSWPIQSDHLSIADWMIPRLRGGKILMDPIHKAVLGEVITVENLFIKDPADKIIALSYYSDSILSWLVVYTEKTEVEQ